MVARLSSEWKVPGSIQDPAVIMSEGLWAKDWTPKLHHQCVEEWMQSVDYINPGHFTTHAKMIETREFYYNRGYKINIHDFVHLTIICTLKFGQGCLKQLNKCFIWIFLRWAIAALSLNAVERNNISAICSCQTFAHSFTPTCRAFCSCSSLRAFITGGWTPWSIEEHLCKELNFFVNTETLI